MRKGFAIGCSLLLTSSILLGACTKDNKEQPAQTEVASKVKFSILNGAWDNFPPDVDPNHNKWTDVFTKAFPNTEIEWVLPPRGKQLEDKKKLMMGAGEFTNLVSASKTEMINWADNGMIIPVDDIVNKYMPNLKNYLSADDLKNGQYLGKQYLIPAPLSSLQNPVMMYIRKDWLEKLNLQMPQTTDELMAVMKAFTTKDPDGNGKNDTFGYVSQKNLALTQTISMAFGVNLNDSNFWHRLDGKLVPDFIRPETKDALAYLREMYQAGVYDKESLVTDSVKLEEKVTSGKYGITPFFSNGMWARLNANVKKADPKAEFVLLPPLKGPKGEKGIPREDNVGTMWAITTGTTPAQAEAIGKLLNWFMEPDTSASYVRVKGDDIAMGQLNVHSTLVGNKYLSELPDAKVSPEAIKDKYRFSYRLILSSSHMLPDKERLEYSKLTDAEKPGFYQDANTFVEFGVRNALKVPGPKLAQYFTDLQTYWDEVKMKIVTGDKPLESFDEWVAYFKKNHGQEIIDEANKLNP